ncbi:hypothetical protein THIOSC13_1210002 [uncultured Thiomicrorhabdus sp.]
MQVNADLYVFGGGNDGDTKLYKLTSGDVLSTLNTAPFALGNANSSGQGILISDPSSDYMIAWNRANSWYQLDAANNAWTELTQSSGDGSSAQTGTPNLSATESFAVGISDYGVIMFVNGGSNDVWLYKHSEATGWSTGSHSGNLIQSFAITGDTTANSAFTVGLGFKKGDITSAETITLDIDTAYSVSEKKYWNDGSLKHAIVSGCLSLTANTPDTIGVYDAGTQPSRITLNEDSIVAHSPTALVGLSGIDTVSLADLLGSPVETWISGDAMVEAHYQVDVVDNVSAWFQVRLYSNDDIDSGDC